MRHLASGVCVARVIALALEQHWHESASEEERAASACVVDLDADEFTCPACMATFAKAPRCPECGLSLSE